MQTRKKIALNKIQNFPVGKVEEATYLSEVVEAVAVWRHNVVVMEVELLHFLDSEALTTVFPWNVFHPLH